MSYTDTVLTCRDCGEQFTWTPGEQEFYAKQGLQNPPARCNPCRAVRKEAQSEQARERRGGFGSPGGQRGGRPGSPGGSGNGRDYRPAFANGSGGSGLGGPRGGRGPGDGRRDAAPANARPYGDRPPRQLFDVVCAECGTPTQVPFLPRGDRPVYCRPCFDKRREF